MILTACKPKSQFAESSPGEQILRSRCQTCHRLPDASRKTAQQWHDWLAIHRQKAKLTDNDLDTLLAYLTRASTP